MKRLFSRTMVDNLIMVASLGLAVFAIMLDEKVVAALLFVQATLFMSLLLTRVTSAQRELATLQPLDERLLALLAKEGGTTNRTSMIEASSTDTATKETKSLQNLIDVDFALYRGQAANSPTGSDLRDLEIALESVASVKRPILVITEFQNKRADEVTLEQRVRSGGPIADLICRNLLAGVDVIPHAGTCSWDLTAGMIGALDPVKSNYGHLLIHLPNSAMQYWLPVIHSLNGSGASHNKRADLNSLFGKSHDAIVERVSEINKV